MRSSRRWIILSVMVLFVVGLTSNCVGQEAQPWTLGLDPFKFGGTLSLARGWEPLSMDS